MSEEKHSGKASEMMKKLLTVGVGAIFLTEESLRGLISEFKLPKEMMGAILDSAGKTKDDFLQKLSHDVLSQLKNKVDFKELIQELLTKNEIQFQVKVSLKPKADPKS